MNVLPYSPNTISTTAAHYITPDTGKSVNKTFP